mmetsp:Transcript_13822/g.25732  ORF Transcript_13822/g.25732 Transcript_13822/m.25732 type:complete len:350 (-) Transcript_13822:305-1354(-)
MSNPRVLVTGGSGFIGSHTVLCLIEAGYDITVVDNYVNSSPESIERVRVLTNCAPERITVFNVDCCDAVQLETVFTSSSKFQACIHFAGLKAVGESVAKPILYYDVNLGSLTTLVKLLDKYDCHRLVFSSSATVYGSAPVPITESTPTGSGITNAYGRTKYMIEEILNDFVRSKGSESDWSVTILRYFNPIGAHPSGQIGEDPNGIPNNLMPYVAQVAVGRREKLSIFGNDYDTPDGTGVRDYIHVLDLARGHLAAIEYMQRKDPSYYVFNLGTGRGESVLNIVKAMENACGHTINYEFSPRRDGDVATCYADTTRAKEELGWVAEKTLDQACADTWKWQSLNPNGFSK